MQMKPFVVPEELKALADDSIEKGVIDTYASKPVRDKILTTRQATHGDFVKVAEYAQHLKTVFRHHDGFGNLTAVQRESIDLMCTKFARILCGNPDHKDHWDDLAGYAKLVAETL
jgi:hypothetical protein